MLTSEGLTDSGIHAKDLKPFVKWTGGKRSILPQLLPHFPSNFEKYFEPFLGGGAVLFYLQPDKATVSDANPQLTNLYCAVKYDVDRLISRLKIHELNHKQLGSVYYYEIRHKEVENSIDKAANFLYLNRTCFNGHFRVNSKGIFNVPVGKYKNPTICDAGNLKAVSEYLQNVYIKCCSFRYVVGDIEENDFVYFDPPYYPISETAKFTQFTKDGFDEEDQIFLRDVFSVLASRGVRVALSNSDCDFIRDLYADFKQIKIHTKRRGNSKASERSKQITELLITANI